jgi:hypothetical protein
MQKRTEQPLLYEQPFSLYDLCIKHIARNINDILFVKNAHSDSIKLNTTICESLLKEYEVVYEWKLRDQERDTYHHYKKCKRLDRIRQNSTVSIRGTIGNETTQKKTEDIITYYDLLIKLAKKAHRFQISKIIYKQCLIKQTPLFENLKKLNLNSKRCQIREHLSDDDFLNYFKLHSNNLFYLDVCPCLLTNRFIKLVNKHLHSLKYFKINNYCGFNGADDCQLFSNLTDASADFDYSSSMDELSMDLDMDYYNTSDDDEDDDRGADDDVKTDYAAINIDKSEGLFTVLGCCQLTFS